MTQFWVSRHNLGSIIVHSVISVLLQYILATDKQKMASVIKSKLGSESKGLFLSELMHGEICPDSLDDLIGDFIRTPYRPEDPTSHRYIKKCWILFKRDYELGQVQNQDGSLCAHYPPIILIPERERHQKTCPKTCPEEGIEFHLTRSRERTLTEDTDLDGWVQVDRSDTIRSLDPNFSEHKTSPLFEEQKNGVTVNDPVSKVSYIKSIVP